MPTERKMCDVWSVPHSFCLLSLTFLEHVPAQKWKKSKYCFSQAHLCPNMPHCNNHISIHPPPLHPPHKNTHHTNIISNMADRLPLAKLSIQNKQPTLPTETTQPIKTKKIRLLQLPKLPHPCSLDVLPSPRDKWSAMTHPFELPSWDSRACPFHMHTSTSIMVVCSLPTLTRQARLPPLLETEVIREVALNLMTSWVTTAACTMKTIMYLCTFSLDLIMEAWAQEVKVTPNATVPLSTCSSPTFLPSPTSTQQFRTRLQTINKPSPVRLPDVPFSFLVQMPSPRQSSKKCGELMTSSNKNLVDHVEISPSYDDASCCSPRLPSTHTTYGQPRTSTMSASSTITLSAAILKASETSSNPSRIPLLLNMFVSPWHRAPHASTSCS
jgi:hypothetical protein